ncbi:hypothetical protein FRC12_020115 [Ceratobasidium sp. 428]|nr:hypothetical protein FRC12_020115 [Ceratobasidium sp. 428]
MEKRTIIHALRLVQLRAYPTLKSGTYKTGGHAHRSATTGLGICSRIDHLLTQLAPYDPGSGDGITHIWDANNGQATGGPPEGHEAGSTQQHTRPSMIDVGEGERVKCIHEACEVCARCEPPETRSQETPTPTRMHVTFRSHNKKIRVKDERKKSSLSGLSFLA